MADLGPLRRGQLLWKTKKSWEPGIVTLYQDRITFGTEEDPEVGLVDFSDNPELLLQDNTATVFQLERPDLSVVNFKAANRKERERWMSRIYSVLERHHPDYVPEEEEEEAEEEPANKPPSAELYRFRRNVIRDTFRKKFPDGDPAWLKKRAPPTTWLNNLVDYLFYVTQTFGLLGMPGSARVAVNLFGLNLFGISFWGILSGYLFQELYCQMFLLSVAPAIPHVPKQDLGDIVILKNGPGVPGAPIALFPLPMTFNPVWMFMALWSAIALILAISLTVVASKSTHSGKKKGVTLGIRHLAQERSSPEQKSLHIKALLFLMLPALPAMGSGILWHRTYIKPLATVPLFGTLDDLMQPGWVVLMIMPWLWPLFAGILFGVAALIDEWWCETYEEWDDDPVGYDRDLWHSQMEDPSADPFALADPSNYPSDVLLPEQADEQANEQANEAGQFRHLVDGMVGQKRSRKKKKRSKKKKKKKKKKKFTNVVGAAMERKKRQDEVMHQNHPDGLVGQQQDSQDAEYADPYENPYDDETDGKTDEEGAEQPGEYQGEAHYEGEEDDYAFVSGWS